MISKSAAKFAEQKMARGGMPGKAEKVLKIFWDNYYGFFKREILKNLCYKLDPLSDDLRFCQGEEGCVSMATQFDFVKAILPREILERLTAGKKFSKSTASRIFDRDNPLNYSRYEKIRDLLLPKNKEPYNYQGLPYKRKITRRWTAILKRIGELNGSIDGQTVIRELPQRLEQYIKENTDSHENPFFFQERLLEQLAAGRCVDILSELALISCTFGMWETPRKEDIPLYDLILPRYGTIPDDSPDTAEDEREREKNNKKAKEILESIRTEEDSFSSEASPEKARAYLDRYLSILEMTPRVSDEYMGKASLSCYKIYTSGVCALPKKMTADFYLKQACFYGNREAIRLSAGKSKCIHYVSQKSPDPTSGICVINCRNRVSSIFSGTVPEGWRLEYCPDEAFDLAKIFNENKPMRFLLADDDMNRNISDLLTLFQHLSDFGTEEELSVYIRGKDAVLSRLVDTVLSRADVGAIPVYILDDAKIDAQTLLSRHPLFYPIRNIPDNSEGVLNLVVIGENDTAAWIVREAYWMMGFRNEKIQCRITIVSDKARELKEELNSLCPMFRESSQSLLKLNSHLPEIETVDCGFRSREFSDWLAKCSMSEYYYFVAAADNDLVNMETAVYIREQFIRRQTKDYKARNGQTDYERQPVISFRCKDPDLASLSRTLEIGLEAPGNQWYNHYGFVSFGAWKDRYSWDTLDGGIMEMISQRIHRCYCVDEKETDRAKIEEAMDSYFMQSYNRDSSYSAALFLPYRLYQYRGLTSSQRILPAYWDIQDDRIFTDPEMLESFADALERLLHIDQHRKKENQALAKLEHERWNRYMIARGWIPAEEDEAVRYIEAGNHRQQLYIARMHPCLIAYDRLKDLQDFLEPYIGRKDFLSVDEKIVDKTGSFLSNDIYSERQKKSDVHYKPPADAHGFA